jgi:CheY-like chemotaxis protein
LPLAVASWAIVRGSSSNDLETADSSLSAAVSVAGGHFARLMAVTKAEAQEAAFDTQLRRAARDGDTAYLKKYARSRTYVRLRVGEDTLFGTYRGPGAEAPISIKNSNVTFILVRPLNEDLLPKLSDDGNASTESDSQLVLLYRGRAIAGLDGTPALPMSLDEPEDLRILGTEYRVDSQVLPDSGGQAGVAAIQPRDEIGGSGGSWWNALWASLATLATVGLIAFLVAPAVAGRRWVRRLLPGELEEQYALEREQAAPYAAPVPSHGTAPTGNGGAAAAQAVVARRRIVVIDDDPEERTLLAGALEPDGADVAATGDAEYGLGLLGVEDADLAILDWQMSGRSGAEILAELNIRHPDVPVLLVADELEPQQRHVATLLGAEDFLIRPLDPEDVTAKAQRLLTAAAADRESD